MPIAAMLHDIITGYEPKIAVQPEYSAIPCLGKAFRVGSLSETYGKLLTVKSRGCSRTTLRCCVLEFLGR